MIVEMGSTTPHQCAVGTDGSHTHVPLEHGEPAVYRWSIPDGHYTHEDGGDSGEILRHLFTNPDVTQLAGHEAVVSIVRDYMHHSAGPPAWVASDNADLERVLAEIYGCERGYPDDVEETHHTVAGAPGVGTEVTA